MFSRLSPALIGVLAMVAASTFWGLSSLFYKLLKDVPPLEVLAHRSVWSLLFFVVVLGMQGRLGALGQAVASRRELGGIMFAALMVSINWFGFIYSVQSGHALEASLGYYIFPLLAVMLGIIVFGDALRPVQGVSVVLAAVAVAVLTFGLGVAPWISLMLAGTFALYGVAKKLSKLNPLVTTAAEVVVLLPVALIWLAGVHWAGWNGAAGQAGGVFGRDAWHTALLVLSGPLTGMPLLLFTFASRRISMTSLGLIQYLNPTLQFGIAVLVFGELFTPWHMAAFALIWTALALYSAESLHHTRARVLH